MEQEGKKEEKWVYTGIHFLYTNFPTKKSHLVHTSFFRDVLLSIIDGVEVLSRFFLCAATYVLVHIPWGSVVLVYISFLSVLYYFLHVM